MTILSQIKNFVRAFIRRPADTSNRAADPLAMAADDLKIVNRSSEDDRLSDPESNTRYLRSLEED